MVLECFGASDVGQTEDPGNHFARWFAANMFQGVEDHCQSELLFYPVLGFTDFTTMMAEGSTVDRILLQRKQSMKKFKYPGGRALCGLHVLNKDTAWGRGGASPVVLECWIWTLEARL